MADWKSALAALGASTENNGEEKKADVERKKRVGVVYSTNPDFEYDDTQEAEAETLPRQQQPLRLNM